MSSWPIITSRSWTPEEDRLLRSMAASGESSAAIGKLLNRTALAIRRRARTLQIKLARSPPGPEGEAQGKRPLARLSAGSAPSIGHLRQKN
jgi:hypothetical protein